VSPVGPIAQLKSEDAQLLLPLRLAFVSLCLNFLNHKGVLASRVNEQRDAAIEWVKALLAERPALLHAYTDGQQGKDTQDI
jgi:hypothetical protein